VSLNGLVVEAKQLKSAQARESADRTIEELKAFISQLSEEAPGAAHMFVLVDCLCRQKISSVCRSASADSNNAKACPFTTLFSLKSKAVRASSICMCMIFVQTIHTSRYSICCSFL